MKIKALIVYSVLNIKLIVNLLDEIIPLTHNLLAFSGKESLDHKEKHVHFVYNNNKLKVNWIDIRDSYKDISLLVFYFLPTYPDFISNFNFSLDIKKMFSGVIQIFPMMNGQYISKNIRQRPYLAYIDINDEVTPFKWIKIIQFQDIISNSNHSYRCTARIMSILKNSYMKKILNFSSLDSTFNHMMQLFDQELSFEKVEALHSIISLCQIELDIIHAHQENNYEVQFFKETLEILYNAELNNDKDISWNCFVDKFIKKYKTLFFNEETIKRIIDVMKCMNSDYISNGTVHLLLTKESLLYIQKICRLFLILNNVSKDDLSAFLSITNKIEKLLWKKYINNQNGDNHYEEIGICNSNDKMFKKFLIFKKIWINNRLIENNKIPIFEVMNNKITMFILFSTFITLCIKYYLYIN